MKRPGEVDEPSLPHSLTDSQSRNLSSPGTSSSGSTANAAQLSQSLSRLCQHSQLNGHVLQVGCQAAAQPEPPQRRGTVCNGRVGGRDGGEGASAERAGPTLLHRPLPSTKFESTRQESLATPDLDTPPGPCNVEAALQPPGGLPQSAAAGRQLQALLAEVQFLVERVREQDRQLSLAEQWQFAASVIDRLFLVGFSVFNIICTIAILMAAPHFGEALSKDFL